MMCEQVVNIKLDNIELQRITPRLYNSLAESGLINRTYKLYTAYREVYSALVKTPENLILGVVVYGDTGRWSFFGIRMVAEKLGAEIYEVKVVRLFDYDLFSFTEPFKLELVKKITDFAFLEKYFGEIDALLYMVRHNKLYPWGIRLEEIAEAESKWACADPVLANKIDLLEKAGFRWLGEKKDTLMWYKVRSNESEASQEA